MKRGKAETGIQSAILRTLKQHPHVLAIRVNAGRRGGVWPAKAGTPDIVCLIKGGRWLGLEVKTEAGEQSATQRLFAAQARLLGGRYAVVRSVPEAVYAVSAGVLEAGLTTIQKHKEEDSNEQ